MKKNSISTFKVAATYIGTVVGAGFASGQEILQFFSVFGEKGFMGLILATFLFMLFGYIVMSLGQDLQASSHMEITKYCGRNGLGVVFDSIITFFLFGSFTAMIAGAGALFQQQFHLSTFWGNLLLAVAAVLTVFMGINGVINSISFVVPFLIFAVLEICVLSFFAPPLQMDHIETFVLTNGLIHNWLWASILYVSYNIMLSISVLGPLGNNAKSKRALRNGAIFGGLGLGVGALAIYICMNRNIQVVRDIEIPMVFIASRISLSAQILYSVVLLAEIYTTAVGSLYGFTARACFHFGKGYKAIILITAVAAFIASQWGFSNLVKYLYPIVGYGGVVLLGILLYSRIKLYLENKI